MNRLPSHAIRARQALIAATVLAGAGLMLHGQLLYLDIRLAGGLSLSIPSALSLIGLQLALIGLLGALEPTLRGMTAGLLTLAAIATIPLGMNPAIATGSSLAWQMQAHILISMFAYGLLTVGAIIATFSLVQDRRLRSGRLTTGKQLFAPVETTEKLLFGVASAGFISLLIAVVSGIAFVEDLFAQHLAHKTVLSLLALALFGVLLGGRVFAGWRGRRAVFLYLWGFAVLCLAYFGSRFVLEELLNRSWG